MIFFPLFLLIVGLQVLHRRLLRRLLPTWTHRHLTWALILLHVPLAFYFALRLTGMSNQGMTLRPFARFGFYFQVVTIFNLLVCAAGSLLLDLRRWMREEAKLPPEDPARRRFLRGSAAVGLGIMAGSAASGAQQAYADPEVTRLDVFSDDLPSGLEGLRLVHLTDLHAGPMVGLAQLQRWRRLAEQERPDLLLLTGDFVDSLPQELAPLLEAFRDFPAPLGRFAVLGNHDYFQDPGPIWDGLERIGISCLENRHVLVERGGAQLAVLGLQDPMARNGRFQGVRFGPGPDPARAAQGIPREAWRMALVHRPSDWVWAVQTGARLTLAGHTHGGQINLVPGLSSARILGPWTSGLYRNGGQALYVSRGLGIVGLPLRFAARPELAVLTLRRGETPRLQSTGALAQ